MLFFDVIKKIIFKIMILFSLVMLTLFNSILKIAIFIFGIAAVPVGTLLLIVTIIAGCTDGFGSESFMMLGAAALIISLKYLLPIIPKSFDSLKFTLKECLYEPLIIRSPVKYTI